MPFYCGTRSASICFVLGSKNSSAYSSEYASGFFEPAALHLPTAPSPRNEGLLGQAPGPPHHLLTGFSQSFRCCTGLHVRLTSPW